MAKQLPIVKLLIDGAERLFYADERLGEYRAIDYPHDRYSEHEIDASMHTTIGMYSVDPLSIQTSRQG